MNAKDRDQDCKFKPDCSYNNKKTLCMHCMMPNYESFGKCKVCKFERIETIDMFKTIRGLRSPNINAFMKTDWCEDCKTWMKDNPTTAV